MRTAPGAATHRALHRRAKRLLRAAGYDAVLTPVVRHRHEQPPVRDGACRRRPGHQRARPLVPQAHELENLWVIDGGFFPSSGAMNPALTIAAQALRVVAESSLAA